MGRAISMKMAALVGVRVAGQLTYIPAHIKNGKKINAQATIPVYANSNKGTDQKTGEKGRSDTFKLVAWGKLADVCCKSLPKGKAIDVFAEPQSYMGKLYNVDGSPRLDMSGQPIEIQKTAFTIMNLIFGEESDKVVAEEIQAGRRPIHWKEAAHPDYQLWIQILHARQAATWDGRNPEFGYARVVVPTGQGIQLDFSQNTQVAAGFGQPAAQPGFSAPQNNYALPGMIANAFGGNPAQPQSPAPLFDPMTGRPLVQQTPQTPRPMFDPMTGRPLYAAPNSGFPDAAGFTPQAPQAPMTTAGTPLF